MTIGQEVNFTVTGGIFEDRSAPSEEIRQQGVILVLPILGDGITAHFADLLPYELEPRFKAN